MITGKKIAPPNPKMNRMEVGLSHPKYIPAAADTRSAASAVARIQKGAGSLFSPTSAFTTASFGMTMGRKSGRLMVIASDDISTRALLRILYSSAPEKASMIVSRRRRPARAVTARHPMSRAPPTIRMR